MPATGAPSVQRASAKRAAAIEMVSSTLLQTAVDELLLRGFHYLPAQLNGACTIAR